MSAVIDWSERDRFAVQRDGAGALVRLRERGTAVEQRAERRGAIFLLDEDLRQAAIAAIRRRELLNEIAELLFCLAQPPTLKAFQAGREGDLVVEVGDATCHAHSVRLC